jgi:hypothetical protein
MNQAQAIRQINEEVEGMDYPAFLDVLEASRKDIDSPLSTLYRDKRPSGNVGEHQGVKE